MKRNKYILYRLLILQACLSIGRTVSAQQTDSVHFIKGKTWVQVQQIARAANKPIFADLYATWCGPCKQMDKQIYPDKAVINYLNAHFICVKYQLDATNNDPPETRATYKDAQQLMFTAGVRALPAMLFYTSGGQLVHAGMGFKSADELLTLGAEALDPNRQYYTLLERYQKGKLDLDQQIGLISVTRNMGDEKTAGKIAEDLTTALLKMDRPQLYTRERLTFLSTRMNSSSDAVFQFIDQRATEIDQVLKQPFFAEQLLYPVIWKELIGPELSSYRDTTRIPDWPALETKITSRYGPRYGHRFLVFAQLGWYNDRVSQDPFMGKRVPSDAWKRAAFNAIDFKALNGLVITGHQMYVCNAVESFIIPYCNDRILLENGAQWLKGMIDGDPENNLLAYMGDYPQLLYRTGHAQEAISWQQVTIEVLRHNLEEHKRKPEDILSYQQQVSLLATMKRGEKLDR